MRRCNPGTAAIACSAAAWVPGLDSRGDRHVRPGGSARKQRPRRVIAWLTMQLGRSSGSGPAPSANAASARPPRTATPRPARRSQSRPLTATRGGAGRLRPAGTAEHDEHRRNGHQDRRGRQVQVDPARQGRPHGAGRPGGHRGRDRRHLGDQRRSAAAPGWPALPPLPSRIGTRRTPGPGSLARCCQAAISGGPAMRSRP